MNTPKLVETAVSFVSRHRTEFLTGIGIIGWAATAVLVATETPKALKLIEEKKQEEDKEKLTPVETVATAWKPYIPAVVTGAVSTACLIGASSESVRRTAALATAYKLSETAFTEYKEKVAETFGEKKEQTIREAIAKDKIENNPVSKSEVIITPRGSTLCFDTLSSRYFTADIDTVKRAEIELNRRMQQDIGGYVTINDYYDEIGLAHTEVGDYLGWNSFNLMRLDISSHVADDGRPALVIGHHTAPRYDFDR